MSPSAKMRLARSVAAQAVGFELPPDAGVEMAIDTVGMMHVSVTFTPEAPE